jgi:hypothetical protein
MSESRRSSEGRDVEEALWVSRAVRSSNGNSWCVRCGRRDRRDVLRLLARAATAASLLPAIAGDGYQRVASVLSTSSRVDVQTIEHIEAVLWRTRGQDYARIGIDHAVAAEYWANRTDDIRLRAYTADVTAQAYAAGGQRGCLRERPRHRSHRTHEGR